MIRGPGSILYGNNAFFGVINVVTRSGRSMRGHGVEGSVEGGTFDTYKGRATWGHQFGTDLEMLFSGSIYESAGPGKLFFKDFGIAEDADDEHFKSAFGTVRWRNLICEGGFITRQYVLLRFADERALLTTVGGELERAGAIVSFNGKSFDAPVLEMRYLFHRLEWAGARLPHVDVLHPARRFWGNGGVRGPRAEHQSCSLVALGRQVLGAGRVSDVPGFEIPARYFQFVRSGDARPLVAVLEHNRLDLLTLAGVTARLVHLVRSGPEEARDAREALALGHLYARAGPDDGRARAAFSRAANASITGSAASIASSAASIASSAAFESKPAGTGSCTMYA